MRFGLKTHRACALIEVVGRDSGKVGDCAMRSICLRRNNVPDENDAESGSSARFRLVVSDGGACGRKHHRQWLAVHPATLRVVVRG
jgi:hypothetical protein